MNNTKLLKMRFESIIQATPRIKIFKLSYGDQEFSFKPGQWIDVYAPVEGKNIGGYTMISSASEKGTIELAIRESLNHPVTKYLHSELKVGDILTTSVAQGKFFLSSELMKSPITFIAGGIGITPILSMFRSIKKNSNTIKLFYSVSYDQDILLKNELAPHTYFTATKEGGKRISYDLLKNNNANFDSDFFICGPRSMIDSLVTELKLNGISSSKIHFEKWW